MRPKTGTPAFSSTDAELTVAVRNVLRWDADVPDDKLEVLVHDGHVTLSGSVGYWYERGAAADAIRRLSGVASVRDRIAVEPHQPGDAEIASDIRDAMTRRTGAQGIRVDVGDGVVTLRGLVLTSVDRVDAERAAWSARGVRDVDNRIVTTR